MTRSIKFGFIFLVLTCTTFAYGQSRGGASTLSAQDGFWNAGTTWVGGTSPTNLAPGQALVGHTVQVATSSQTAGGINGSISVGHAGGSGTLNITGGDISVSGIGVGNSNPSIVNLSGGTLSSSGGISVHGASEFNISGGSLQSVGANAQLLISQPGTSLKVIGASGTISINDSGPGTSLNFFADATLIIQPTANGAAGLSTLNIIGGDVSISATNTTLELDLLSYSPQVGDSWDIITYNELITGSFITVTAPAGYTIVEDQSTPGLLKITVTGVPTPELPTTNYSGLSILLLLFIITSSILLNRRKAHGTL